MVVRGGGARSWTRGSANISRLASTSSTCEHTNLYRFMPLTHPSRKLGTEKDVHLTYESCMASLHATGKLLMKRLPPGPLWWLHFPKCGTSFGSTLHGYLCQADESHSALVLHHDVFSRTAPLGSCCAMRSCCTINLGLCHAAARLLQLACARQTNSTHGFAHPNPNPNPNPTTAGLSTTPCNVGRRTGSR